MPFTFLVELLYKFKKEIFIALAAIALIGGAYWYHVSEVNNTRDIYFKAGKDTVYAILARTPIKSDTIRITKWVSLPPETAKGKIDTQYVYTNLDSMTVDSLKKYTRFLETPFTAELPTDSLMELKARAIPKEHSIVFFDRRLKTTQTTVNNSQTIVKDFDGLNYAITGSITAIGRTTIGAAYRYKQFLFGPSYQILGPNPGVWYNRTQLNATLFLD
ncbi:MAG: hypothetical protein WC666_04220 [Candidatus Paceibacterota bacterium]|jgi:hypothetical protein